MAQPKLLAVLTALLLLGHGSPLRAGYTLDQLQAIERMLSAKDWTSLATYIARHPELVQGNDPLAVELQRFTTSYDSATVDTFVPGRIAASRERNIPFGLPY
jgi:hypothetical protein